MNAGIPWLVALVIVANVAPWAAARVFGSRWVAPLDMGTRLRDGSRALGENKTWRGLAAGTLSCALTALLLGYGFTLGAALGFLSIAADAASSFLKRRLGALPSVEFPLLDQLPEALLPLTVLSRYLRIGFIGSLGVAAVFLVLDLATTGLRHR